MKGRSYTVCKSDVWAALIQDAGEAFESALPHVQVRLKGRYSASLIVRAALTMTTKALGEIKPSRDLLLAYAERYQDHADSVFGMEQRGGFRFGEQSQGEAEWLLDYLKKRRIRVPKMPILYAIFVAVQFATDQCRERVMLEIGDEW